MLKESLALCWLISWNKCFWFYKNPFVWLLSNIGFRSDAFEILPFYQQEGLKEIFATFFYRLITRYKLQTISCHIWFTASISVILDKVWLDIRFRMKSVLLDIPKNANKVKYNTYSVCRGSKTLNVLRRWGQSDRSRNITHFLWIL